MLDGKSVAVVVPALNEEALVGVTVAAIPAFVDRIIVVDDASKDATVERAKAADPRVEVVVHEQNQGVGAAIITGYKRAIEHEADVTAVMAADNQMDPDDLETLVGAVATGRDRLREGEPPRHRPGLGPHSRAAASSATRSSRSSPRSPRATGTWPTRSPATRRSASRR